MSTNYQLAGNDLAITYAQPVQNQNTENCFHFCWKFLSSSYSSVAQHFVLFFLFFTGSALEMICSVIYSELKITPKDELDETRNLRGEMPAKEI